MRSTGVRGLLSDRERTRHERPRQRGMLRAVRSRFAVAPVLLTGVLGACIAMSPGELAAAAGAHAATAKPPAPATGPWRITAFPAAFHTDELHGTFTITANHYVTGFQGTIQSSASPACGTGTVSVTGEQKINYKKGSYYFVGPSTSKPDTVSVVHAGTKIKGKFGIEFATPAAIRSRGAYDGGGLIYGACQLPFAVAAG